MGHGLHEGRWAGWFGGVVSLLSALGLLTMLGTGIVSWWKMRRKAAWRGSLDKRGGCRSLQ